MTKEIIEHKNILIVEDDEYCMFIYKEALAEHKFLKITSAASSEEAIEILEKNNFNFDLCLIDQNLPGMKGEDLLTWIKEKVPTIAVIIVTGSMNENFIYSCLQKGALDYIRKPVKLKSFCATIIHAMERQSKINEAPGEIRADVQTGGWVELTAPSEMEYLARMQIFANTLLETQLPEKASQDLRLIMEELGRNAIEWGNKFDRTKEFKISYCIFPNSIVLKFEDEGEGFHPEGIRDPTLDPKAHIMKRKEEG
ncbi:MAG: ATP-binding protein, partial [Planctomycetota bacterium]